MSTEYHDLLSLLPPIRRARGYRLYTADNRRFLDLWQAGGRAILGHRGGKVVTRIKQDLDRGLLFPSYDRTRTRRLVQALTSLLPGAFPSIATVFPSIESFLHRARSTAPDLLVVDSAAPDAERLVASPSKLAAAAVATIWRPFLDPEGVVGTLLERSRWILPVLPDGGLAAAQVVLDRIAEPSQLHADPVSTASIGSLAVAAYAVRDAPARPELHIPGFRSVGPYLWYEGATPYESLFREFLQAGILLSPDVNTPSIIPGELSDGERAALERVAKES